MLVISAIQEAEKGGSFEPRSFKPVWAPEEDPAYKRYKISQAWWCMLVVPAT